MSHLAFVLCLAAASSGAASHAPEPPRRKVELPASPPSLRIVHARSGAELQRALQTAKGGDVIELEPGGVYEGPFVLPPPGGSGWVLVRSAAAGRLEPGRRIDVRDAALLATLTSREGPVLRAAPGASHFWLVGLEIRPAPGVFVHNLVELGETGMPTAALPHHIVFERCFVHGDPERGGRRGIAMNGAHIAVLDSLLTDFKEVGADSQGIAGWSGPGPFLLANNVIVGAGENVMFGGADPPSPDRIPSDIEVVGNHFHKPLEWKLGEKAYAGKPWTVKNLFELKNARRVRIDGNLFERHWAHAQNGFAILFTVRNQEGSAPWSVVEDVSFTNNVVRHSASGINILGRHNEAPGGSRRTSRVLIQNNLFTELGDKRWGNGGILFQLLDGTDDVVIEGNTALQAHSIVVADGAPHRGFVFRDNVVRHNEYGIFGSGAGVGKTALERYFPGAVVRGNVMIGGDAADYPPANYFPRSEEHVGFAPSFQLAGQSPYRGRATNGTDPGIDPARLAQALAASRRRAERVKRP